MNMGIEHAAHSAATPTASAAGMNQSSAVQAGSQDQALFKQLFQVTDAGGDGLVSQQEFNDFLAYALTENAAANGQAAPTTSDYSAAVFEAVFQEADLDGNMSLSAEEFNQFLGQSVSNVEPGPADTAHCCCANPGLSDFEAEALAAYEAGYGANVDDTNKAVEFRNFLQNNYGLDVVAADEIVAKAYPETPASQLAAPQLADPMIAPLPVAPENENQVHLHG